MKTAAASWVIASFSLCTSAAGQIGYLNGSFDVYRFAGARIDNSSGTRAADSQDYHDTGSWSGLASVEYTRHTASATQGTVFATDHISGMGLAESSLDDPGSSYGAAGTLQLHAEFVIAELTPYHFSASAQTTGNAGHGSVSFSEFHTGAVFNQSLSVDNDYEIDLTGSNAMSGMLAPGTYTLHIEVDSRMSAQFGEGTGTARFSVGLFVGNAVPAPSSWAFFGVSGICIAHRRRRC